MTQKTVNDVILLFINFTIRRPTLSYIKSVWLLVCITVYIMVTDFLRDIRQLITERLVKISVTKHSQGIKYPLYDVSLKI